jgi:hypothetical protein
MGANSTRILAKYACIHKNKYALILRRGALRMTIDQVIDHFGSVSATAKAVRVKYQAVAQWVSKGSVPEGRQWQIQALTDGALTADKETDAA